MYTLAIMHPWPREETCRRRAVFWSQSLGISFCCLITFRMIDGSSLTVDMYSVHMGKCRLIHMSSKCFSIVKTIFNPAFVHLYIRLVDVLID